MFNNRFVNMSLTFSYQKYYINQIQPNIFLRVESGIWSGRHCDI